MNTMTLGTHKILFCKTGENLSTPATPHAIFDVEKHTALLDVVDTFCLSFDDDRLVSGNKFEVHDVALPEWLSPEEWVSDYVSWKYTWGCGVDPTWAESTQRALMRMSTAQRIGCVKLLKTKAFRSEFRASLRKQLDAWIAAPTKTHASPFSPRQWDCLIDRYIGLEASQTDSRLYHDRHYRGAPKAA